MSQFSDWGWGFLPEELKVLPKISVSGLCLLRESPAHFQSRYILKEQEPDTDAMKLGTAVHMALLEPERFDQTYCVLPPDSIDLVYPRTIDDFKRFLKEKNEKTSGTKPELTARYKELYPNIPTYDEWLAEVTRGRVVLKYDEWKACIRIRERVAENPGLKFQITGGEPEKLGWAKHKRTGVIVTFKADNVKQFNGTFLECGGVVADVKKVGKGKTKKRLFENAIWEYSMFVQAAAYVEILGHIFSKKMMFLWIAAEDKPPYPVVGLVADFGLLEAGTSEMNRLLDLYLECLEKNNWPLPVSGLENVTLPLYAWGKLDGTSMENYD